MFFKDILGHKDIISHFIKNINEGRIAHAMLISGPEGCGKMNMAIAFARYILCDKPSNGDGCGVCPSCVQVSKIGHPDLHFVFPVFSKKGDSEVISDDFYKEWKEYLLQSPYISLRSWSEKLDVENKQPTIFAAESSSIIKKLSLKPYETEYKVMIVYLPERMHVVCSNKLLKILEEPPEKTVIILVTENSEQLLSTIVSRCQIIRIKPIPTQTLASALEEKFSLQLSQANNIARISGGNYVKAVEIIQSNEDNKMNLDLFKQLMRLSYSRGFIELKKWADVMNGLGRERQKNFLEYALTMLRENFILNINLPQITYMTPDEEAFSTKFSSFIDAGRVYEMVSEIELAIRHIEQNVNSKMVFFDLSYKLSQLLLIS